MYEIYLDKLMLPVAPKSINIKHVSKNEEIELASGGEYNVLGISRPRDVSFTCLLPNREYNFARYNDGFAPAIYYIKFLDVYMNNKKPIIFKVIRKRPSGSILWNSSFRVSVENFEVNENAEFGLDVEVTINLKEYRTFKTEVIKDDKKVVVREDINSPKPTETITYTIKNGDSLWGIAKSHYGDGNLYTKILSANSDKITNANLIYAGDTINIPSI